MINPRKIEEVARLLHKETTKKLNRTLEGLRLANVFIEYAIGVNTMLTSEDPSNIIKVLKEYGLKMCDQCGGAMCMDIKCPVGSFIEDMDKYLKGEVTGWAGVTKTE